MNRKIVGLTGAVLIVALLLTVGYFATRPPVYAADVDMQIVYAHFWNAASGEASEPPNYTPVTYVVILNVTNHALQQAHIDPANIIVGGEISQTGEHQWSFGNIVIFDDGNGQLIGMNASSSRLIAITGFTDLADMSKPFDVYAHIIADPPSELGRHDEKFALLDSSAFQTTNNGYLYNILLNGDQKLLIDGINAQVIGS